MKWVIIAYRELFLLIVLCMIHNSKQIFREEQEYEGRINNDERKIMHFQFVYITQYRIIKAYLSLVFSGKWSES